ncbi:hypothetical protein BDN67DRAFT_984501 [Paxillus ammoniavirescens]|nr:hypothetical protein BDN67DRAFT_984501 [Paxillus ammoniavirescens]
MKVYAEQGALLKLAKTATSRVAASNISGCTLHSWAGIPICTPRSTKWGTHPTPEMAAQQKKNILGKLLLIVDEMSMLTTDMLSLLSQVTSIVIGPQESTIPFGGLSVLLSGNFHQFPPVAKQNRALFIQLQPKTHSEIGCNLYLQFETIVTLSKQMRVTDPVWNDILDSSAHGPLTIQERVTIAKMPVNDTAGLLMQCKITIGMEVMVTENVSPTTNLANGSRATVTNITLDPREPSLQTVNDGNIHLLYPPLFILVKLKMSDLPALPHLERQEVPLCPVVHDFCVGGKPRTKISR